MNRCLTLPLVNKFKADTVSTVTETALDYRIFRTIADVDPILWSELTPPENLFFNKNYLLALEKSVDRNVRFRYLVINKNKRPVGVQPHA